MRELEIEKKEKKLYEGERIGGLEEGSGRGGDVRRASEAAEEVKGVRGGCSNTSGTEWMLFVEARIHPVGEGISAKLMIAHDASFRRPKPQKSLVVMLSNWRARC